MQLTNTFHVGVFDELLGLWKQLGVSFGLGRRARHYIGMRNRFHRDLAACHWHAIGLSSSLWLLCLASLLRIAPKAAFLFHAGAALTAYLLGMLAAVAHALLLAPLAL